MQHRRLVRSPRRQLLLAEYQRTKSEMRRAMEDHAKTVKAAFEGIRGSGEVLTDEA
jgi:hypothetical protein